MDNLYIETLNISKACEEIDKICCHNGMQWDSDIKTDFGTSVFKVPFDFPVSEIEENDWFLGYAVKEE